MTAGPERRDAFNAPLDADLLIEASAGTGKTYALTTLAARLIVEERRAIDNLLIVTFTISAPANCAPGSAEPCRQRAGRSASPALRSIRRPSNCGGAGGASGFEKPTH